MEKADRDGIAILHGSNKPMLNMRDASNQISSPLSRSVWKKPPTPIHPAGLTKLTSQASGSFTRSRGVGSPYDNMSSNRTRRRSDKSEAYGNTTAATKVFSQTPDRRAGQGSFGKGSSTSSRRGVTDVIEIFDNDEDIGTPVQSDPMNMVDDTPFIPPSKKLKHAAQHYTIYSDESHRDIPLSPTLKKRLPKDGADTIALEKQINNQDSDTIEEFSEESSPANVRVRKGNVKEKIIKYEANSAPHIDLRTVVSHKGSGIKNRMKSKRGGNHGITVSSFKPSTISPHFRNLSSSLTNTSFTRKSYCKIRVNEFYLGTELKASKVGYSLCWGQEERQDTVTIEECGLGHDPSDFRITLHVQSEIGRVKSTPSPLTHNFPIMEFSTISTRPVGSKEDHVTFKMGDSQAIGKITLRFDTEQAGWRDEDYNKLYDWITARTQNHETVSGLRGAQSMWEMAGRSAAMQAVLRKRKGSVELSQDPRPAKRSTPGSVRRLAGDESTPPPVDRLGIQSSKPWSSASTSSRATIIPQPPRTRNSPPAHAGVLRRSSRKHAPTIGQTPSVDPDEVILCYPQGIPGAVNITNADFKRLQPGEFLNDTLIEFGLKLWLRNLESTNPELAKQIHVFSSFFYKKLNTRNIEDGYNSVRKWTSKVDLFSKKYIIVPINEHLHWYLAIIYHPAHILNPPPPPKTLSPSTRSRTQAPSSIPANPIVSRISPTPASPSAPETANEIDTLSDNAVEKNLLNFDASCSITVTKYPPNTTDSLYNLEDTPSPLSEIDSDNDDLPEGDRYNSSPTLSVCNTGRAPSPASGMNDAESSSTGAAEVEQIFANDMYVEHVGKPTVVEPNNFYGKASSKAQGKQREARVVNMSTAAIREEEQREPSPPPSPATMTYIFTLDSLGSNHPQAIKQLKQYLKLEAKDKHGLLVTSEPCGKKASVPVQPNFCDCGLYLVHFAQKFVTDPDRYCRIINTRAKNPSQSIRQEDWEESKIADMRENMAKDISRLSAEWKQAREEARKKELDAKAIEVAETTDDDVDIVETISAPDEKHKGKGGGTPRRGLAKRLR